MRRAKNEARYTKSGQRLRPGETEKIKGGEVVGYEFRKQIRGKRHTIFATSLRELREKEDELTGYIRDGIQTGSITLNDMYERWKAGAGDGLAGTTYANYVYMYDRFVKPDLGKMQIKKILTSDIMAFYKGLRDKGLAVKTLDTIQTPISQTFDLAVADRIIYYNPALRALREIKKQARRTGGDETERAPLTILQQDALEKYLCESKWAEKWGAIFLTFLYTGMRCGEVCGLQWSDIDFQAEEIIVRHNLVYYDRGRVADRPNVGYEMHDVKTAAGRRTIPMLPEVKTALLRHREATFYRRCTRPVDGFKDFVFLNRNGAPFNQEALNRALERIVLSYNGLVLNKNRDATEDDLLPHITCHIFRHTFASRMVEMELPDKLAQTVLGHADIRTTKDIYVKLDKYLTNAVMQERFPTGLAEIRQRQLEQVRQVAERARA